MMHSDTTWQSIDDVFPNFNNGAKRSHRTAIAVSIVAHLAVLFWQVGEPNIAPFFAPNTPLEVVIVNASTADIPIKPEALAQANVDGGGEQGIDVTASPLPAESNSQDGLLASPSVTELEKRAEQLAHEQETMRAQLQSLEQLGAVTEAMRSQLSEEQRQQADAMQEQINQLKASIEEKTRAFTTLPRTGYVTSITAKKAIFATYYDQVRRKIEDFGSINFPTWQGQKLYGRLVVTINVQGNGRLGMSRPGYEVPELTISQSSGNPELDRQTIAIVKASAPFPPFDAALAKEYDVLAIISTFTYSQDGSINVDTEVQTSPARLN